MVYAHRLWDVLPHNAKDLKTRLKCGSLERWKKFVKGRKLFIRLRSENVSKKDAMEQVYQKYKVRLKKVKKWEATKGTPGMRKGPTESIIDRKAKPGPKSKFSKGTVDSIFRYSDYHTDATLQEIADHANDRLSQATETELSQISQEVLSQTRKKTVKGKFKISAQDVGKILLSGMRRSEPNTAGNKRGKGRISHTRKQAEKRPRNWVEKDRQSFIDGRNDKDLPFTLHFDTTPINKKAFDTKHALHRYPAGKAPKVKTNERIQFNTGTAYTATWPGGMPMEGDFLDETVDPGDYASLEFNKYRCQRKGSRKACPHGPDSGPRRKHGGSGTAPIHRYHMRKAITKMLKDRGITKANSKKRRGKKKKRPQVTVQIDKSTCLSYNLRVNEFGYKGVPTGKMEDLMEEVAHEFAVDVKVDVQPTHTFDFNAQDAMYHSELKYKLRSNGLPKDNDELLEYFNDAVDEISLNAIQRGFVRAYSRDSKGDVDMELVPESISGWYTDNLEEMSSDDEDAKLDENVDSEEVHTDEED